jgi:hypothetical protein
MSLSLSSWEKGKGKETLVPSSSATLSETDLRPSSSQSTPRRVSTFPPDPQDDEELGSASSDSSSSASSSSEDSESDSEDDSDSDTDSDIPDEEQLAALLKKAKAKARLQTSTAGESSSTGGHKEEEVIKLDGDDSHLFVQLYLVTWQCILCLDIRPLPALDPGLLKYTRTDVDQAASKDASTGEPQFETYVPTPPPPPKDTSITKAQRKAVCIFVCLDESHSSYMRYGLLIDR